jgi:hypothetical protein
MNHLTDEQLSARLDDALSPGERAACDAHLAGCDACRARLAEASALDASLGKALAHDPGERYFADFADRVAKRIDDRASGASGAASSRRGPWAWLMSPRGLTLAGSTAALLVVAGLAWMRFHDEQDAGRALHVLAQRPAAPPAGKASAPGANDEVQPAPAASAPAAPSSGERARSDAAAPPRDLARLQEVRTLPNGEQVPVPRPEERAGTPAGPEASGNAPAAPATGSAIAQLKRRSITPAAGGGPPPAATVPGAKTEPAPREEAQRASSKDAEAPSSRTTATPSAPAAPTFAREPAAARQQGLDTDTARGRSFGTWGATKSLYKGGANEMKSDARAVGGLVATCGRVRDSSGRVVAGAQVTAVHDGVRSARTDAEGAFCIDGLAAGDTLTVMHVGFDPYTVVMTPMTSLAITLDPVGTLGPNATMLTGRPQASPTFSGALRSHVEAPADTATAPPPDVYAGLSSGIHQLVADARAATAVAQRKRTAPDFENAASQWATVLRQVSQVKGAPTYDASFQYVGALRSAYQLEPTSERDRRLRSAIAAFLASVPATRPERATVERWQAELNAPPDR